MTLGVGPHLSPAAFLSPQHVRDLRPVQGRNRMRCLWKLHRVVWSVTFTGDYPALQIWWSWGKFRLEGLKMDYLTLFKIKVPKGIFHSDAVGELFLVRQRTFQWTVLKRTIFFLLWRTLENSKEPFFTINIHLLNEKMLKALHGTKDANKEPLFLRV